MKLELKHLAPYLPYGLKYRFREIGGDVEMFYHSIAGILNRGDKIYLRPLSDLTKEIEHNGEKFVPMHEFWNANEGEFEIRLAPNGAVHNATPYWIIQKLFEWHFDVFNLIPQGLAIKKTR